MLVISFHSSDIHIKGILTFLIILIYGLMVKNIRPYRIKEHNIADLYASMVVGITIIIGVFLHNNQSHYMTIFWIIIISIMNSVMLLYLINEIGKSFAIYFEVKDKIFNLLNKKAP